MGYVYLIVALIAIGGGGFGVWSYENAIKQAEAKEAEAVKLRETIEIMETSIVNTQKLASARSARAAKAEAEAGTFKQELEKLKNAEKPSSDWANERIPDGILRLREEGRFAPAVQSANDKLKLNPSPTTNGPD